MSRSSTPFSDAGSDIFFPTIKHDDDLYGESTYLYEDDDELKFAAPSDLGFGFQDGTIAPTNTRAGTRTSTPDFVETALTPDMDFNRYDYENKSEAYFFSDEVESHPYALQRREALCRKHAKRSMPARPTTYDDTHPNTNEGCPNSLRNFVRTHPPSHRRSFSDSDAGNIVHSPPTHYPQFPQYPHFDQHGSANQHPTFFRLRETRSRPLIKGNDDDLKYKKFRGRRVRPSIPTSIPTGIGAPLSLGQAVGSAAEHVPVRSPALVHMPHSVQRSMSQRVIEVGAMAVLNIPKGDRKTEAFIDPRLLDVRETRERSAAPSPEIFVETQEDLKEKLLQDLDNMEKRLKEGGDAKGAEEGLKGCEMIRAAFAKMEDHDVGVKEKRSKGDSRLSEKDDSELEIMLLHCSPKPKEKIFDF